MFKIGYFSRISQVSVQTLRYYDRVGLLQPAHIDTFTGYRYYSIDQLSRLNRILALKDLGLSLEQIAQILTGDLPPRELRGMLRLKLAQLKDQKQMTEVQLGRVEARLRHLEMEGKMPDFEVILKTVEPVLVAGCRTVFTEGQGCLTTPYNEARQYVEAQNGKTVDPFIILFHTPVGAQEEDVEVAIPLAKPIPENDRIKVHQLPAEHIASVLFKGQDDNIGQGYDAILSWIDRNGYQITGPFREVYHKLSSDDQEENSVEIQFPIEKTTQ